MKPRHFRLSLNLWILCFSLFNVSSAQAELLNHTLKSLFPRGEINLHEAYKDKVILAVNTASACGFTPQFKDLEALYQKYKDQGFVILGFPSNDFYQEQKEGDEIVEFCKLNYGVTFPMFTKSSVKGDQANPFYKDLITAADNQAPKWNFFKYLIDQNQKVIGYYRSQEKPLGGQLETDIQVLLSKE